MQEYCIQFIRFYKFSQIEIRRNKGQWSSQLSAEN